MEAKEITEGNIVLAEFMGRCGKQNKNLYWVNVPNTEWVTIEQMKFHNSLNWIMSVVDKIESIKDKNDYEKFNVIIERNYCTIIDLINNDEIVYLHADTKKEAMFQACVEFAKWYKANNN